MNTAGQAIRVLSIASAITFFMFGWPITMATSAEGLKVSLSGDQEVPPVSTSASANGTITVSPNKSVSGSITVSGIQPTAAHIHEGAQGENGPVVIPLTKSSDNAWSVSAGAKLTTLSTKAMSPGSFTSTCTVLRIRAVKYERS
jgi:hypothetical protein